MENISTVTQEDTISSRVLDSITTQAVFGNYCKLNQYFVTSDFTVCPRGEFTITGDLASACGIQILKEFDLPIQGHITEVTVTGPVNGYLPERPSIFILFDKGVHHFHKIYLAMQEPLKNYPEMSLEDFKSVVDNRFDFRWDSYGKEFISPHHVKFTKYIAGLLAFKGYVFVPDDGDVVVESLEGSKLDDNTAESIGTGRWYGPKAWGKYAQTCEICE